MNLRTITYFINPSAPLSDERLAVAGKTLIEMRLVLEEAGYTVQTVRLASSPFPAVVESPTRLASYAQALEEACFFNRIDYATLGPARPEDASEWLAAIPEALNATEAVFASAIIADPVHGISLPVVRQVAEVIRACATIRPDGFGNLRFAALANVPPGCPFLPAAYHDDGSAAFAIGFEAAELAVKACQTATSLAQARAMLVQDIETHAKKITSLVRRFSGSRGLRFNGLDVSLAPYPSPERSLGTALERLTGHHVGEHGTLAATAFLAEALSRAKIKSAGFSGVFLPVFEDAVLAARAKEGLLTLSDLLAYSAVCGTGLDTVPLPGDLTADQIAPLLLDVAALALRLNKPLTARLMPLPGKQAGDEVAFDFQYFAPTRVLHPRSSGLGGLFAGDETFDLAPRPR